SAGRFTDSGFADLVTVNPGSNTLAVLAGLGQGRFANPVTLQAGFPARVACVEDFNADGVLDLAVLADDGLSVYLANGRGSFILPARYGAGPDPTGLTVTDVNHDGQLDLLVGNPFGDILILQGLGDGTFRPPRKADQSIALAVADLTGDGIPEAIFANQGLD